MYNRLLVNKVVIVTGGSGGIGSAMANKLSDCEANVISVYNNNCLFNQSNENVSLVKANLTKSEDWDRLLAFTLNKHGKIDVLINCAGSLEPGNFLSLEEKKIGKMIDLNFKYLLIGIQKTLEIMKNQEFGHIINIGSLGGIVPMPYSAVYSATKFALRGFTFSLAEELKKTGIKISLVTPGPVITKMLDQEAQDNDTAISYVSKPICPTKVADSVLKVLIKPKLEIIVPRIQSTLSKPLVISPIIFSRLYNLLRKIGIVRKRKYLSRYCDFSLAKGEIR